MNKVDLRCYLLDLVLRFIRYLWPLIIIDAVHLKGSYKGTNLVAVGMDDNNKILPIAMGLKARPVHHGPVLCAGKKIRGIFWKTCKAYTTHEFNTLLAVLRGYKPDGVQKLKISGFDKWSKAYCPTNRYNYMISNSVESVNSLSRFVRKLPVTRLVEYFRGLLQRCQLEDQKLQTAYNQKGKHPLLMDALGVVSEDTTKTHVRNRYLVNRRGKEWQDIPGLVCLEAQEPKTHRKRRTNVNSCPTQIVPVQFTEDAMGISEWAGPAEWRQYSYNLMNNWMTQ
ncbi:hypothetical protein Tco_1509876 [Tanacetum coccineum]